MRLRQLEVRLTLADGGLADLERGLGLPHLLLNLAVFDDREDLPSPDRVAKLDADRFQPAVDFRHDCTVAAPIRLPTIRICSVTARALDDCELDRHRRAGRAAAPPRPPGRQPATAPAACVPDASSCAPVVDKEARQREHRNDEEEL